MVSFVWFISGQENFLHVSWFPQSENSAEQGRVARPHMTRSLRSQHITPTGFLVTPHRPGQIPGWGGLEFSSQREGKQRTIFNLPKSALWAQSVYMPFIGTTHPTSLGAPTKQTGPHSSLHWPCLGLACLKSRIPSSSQRCLPTGVPGVVPQHRALRPLKTCDPDLVVRPHPSASTRRPRRARQDGHSRSTKHKMMVCPQQSPNPAGSPWPVPAP